MKKTLRRTTFLFLTIIFFFPSSLYANSQSLKKISQKIADLQSNLTQEEQHLNADQESLKKTETDISSLQLSINNTHSEIKKNINDYKELAAQSQQYQAQLKESKALLSQLLKTTYKLGKTPYLKLILNQKDPTKVSRALNYYHYINEEQFKAMQHLQSVVEKLNNTQQNLLQKTKTLETLKLQQEAQKTALNNSFASRETLITNESQHIQTQKSELIHLKDNKVALEKTLHALPNDQINNLSKSNHVNFTNLKNHLPWPTRGHLLQGFNTPIANSELTWNGVLIKAPLNQRVTAVANGKVVFANWLPGYGFLIILHHGEGYMTLYGRNQTLTKKIGEWVTQNETIATVGMSGGYDQPALYFAIRHNTEPLNPTQWCIR